VIRSEYLFNVWEVYHERKELQQSTSI